MDGNNSAAVCRDIALRTGGDVYIGVVGPVRTGKSTFIKRFAELMMLPAIEDEYELRRVTDELPQSGSGRTVMTTQPKFVPNEAVRVNAGDGVLLKVRLVDCVGFMVEGALGQAEDDIPRMVRTPWSDRELPFDEAAEIGTKKVITEHSTVGVCVLTDGSITDIARQSYEKAEERVLAELEAAGKPYIILLNSTHPADPGTLALADALREKYGAPLACTDVMNMSGEDIRSMLEGLLSQFPLAMLTVALPRWVTALGEEHPLLASVMEKAAELTPKLSRMRDAALAETAFSELPDFLPVKMTGSEPGVGAAHCELAPKAGVFYRILSEECDYPIADETDLMRSVRELVRSKKTFDRVSAALGTAEATGYGMVPPEIDNMQLDEPEIIRRGGRFGVRLKARASGLHIIRVDLESEVNPLVGTAEQSEELINYLNDKFSANPEDIWSTNIFGKSLYDLVKEGMAGKTERLSAEVQQKLREAVTRMVNEGCRGLVCIML